VIVTTAMGFRELGEFILGDCQSDEQAALLATIAAGQEHVLTLMPEGNSLRLFCVRAVLA
jgi:hypothetical protein